MKSWLLLGISAYFLYACSSSVDKYLMDEGGDALITNCLKMFVDGFVILLPGVFLLDFGFGWSALFYSSVLGVIYGVSGVVYFKVLQVMDVNKVIPLAQSSRLSLIFVFSLVLLGESAIFENFLGVAASSVGVFLILAKKGLKMPEIDKGLMLLGLNLFLAVTHSLLAKVLVQGINPETLSTMMYFTSATFLLTIQLRKGKGKKLKKVLTSQKLPKIGLAGLFGGIATLTLFQALETGKASQVYPLAGIQTITILLISTTLLNEKTNLKNLTGILITALGIYLVQI